MKILIVDDEPAILDITKTILGRYHTVEAINCPRAALERLPEPWDLLLTDVMMPHLLGTVLAERFLAIHPDKPVIFMTGFAPIKLPADAKAIYKPFNTDELLAMVTSTIDN
jgi:DNA-binding NtrC family response regulator